MRPEALDADLDFDLDFETPGPCQTCGEGVNPGDPYWSTPCGTFCSECMEVHTHECGVCQSEFKEDFQEKDERARPNPAVET